MGELGKFCVSERATILEAAAVIQCNASRCAVVINDQDKVVAVFSEGDILRSILEGTELHTPIKRLIKPSFKYLNEKDMAKAWQLMKEFGITFVPVVDKHFKLQDVITAFDVMDHLVYTNGAH